MKVELKKAPPVVQPVDEIIITITRDEAEILQELISEHIWWNGAGGANFAEKLSNLLEASGVDPFKGIKHFTASKEGYALQGCS